MNILLELFPLIKNVNHIENCENIEIFKEIKKI